MIAECVLFSALALSVSEGECEPATTPVEIESEQVEAAPEPDPEPEPTTPEVEDVWHNLAVCESGYGDGPTWDINTGNGFYGGLQFEKRTWDWMGGQEFAEYPHQATPEQQIAVAERLRQHEQDQGRGGYNPWPACADKLGLPR